MQQIIEKMVTDFERGKLSRRQLAAALAGLVAVGATAAPSAPDRRTGKGPRSITSPWVSQTSSLKKPERSWRS
jgi:hypothetical protein